MQLIKSIIPFIAQPLSELINKSFVTGSFPNELIIARVCPVFKGGNAADFSNYRPISILPSFHKIYERLVYNQLMSFIDKHDLLYHNQFGFRIKHDTCMAVIEMFDRILQAMDSNFIYSFISPFMQLEFSSTYIRHLIPWIIKIYYIN